MGGSAKATASHRQIPPARDSEPRLRGIFEGAAIGIAICGPDGRVLESNPALSNMLGGSPDELVGLHPWEINAGDSPQDRSLLEPLIRGSRDSFALERRYVRRDGSPLWGHWTVSAVREPGGEPAFLLAMLEDTTERKREAQQLREAEKMEVIGRLAGGIAHDFNNLLTGILLYCDLLAAGLDRSGQLGQHVEEIRLAGEQGAALTQQLLAFARKQIPQPQPMRLNELVSSTENLLRRLIGEQIELVTVFDPNAGAVLADQAQLRQVLFNLVLNARDAMPRGGRITVTTHLRDLPGGGRPGVSLVVEDNGCGMDEETRGRVFEPFFTTKKAGHGTGLGLSTVQRIVDESCGTIQMESAPGRGTRIEVLLPALEVAAPASLPKTRPRAGETILLVDDHVSARNSMQRVLHHAGYRVLQASSGKRALKIFGEHARDVELLITDSMMPEMSGRELAEQLRRQKASLKVLLISGYHDGKAEPEAAVKLIRKPFSGHVLMERIREVLDSKEGQPC